MSDQDRRYGKYSEDGRDNHWGVTFSSSSVPPQVSAIGARQQSAPSSPQPVKNSSAADAPASPTRLRRGTTEQVHATTPTRSSNQNEDVEFTLRSMLPSKWNVPKNHADVRKEKNALRLVGRIPAREEEESSVLVVTNKPIPMEVLHNIASKTRQEFHAPSGDAVNAYYFEVTIQKGITWVGLVPSKKLRGPVTLGRFPGDCDRSIGMSSDGRLYASGHELQVTIVENSTNVSERDTIGCGLEVGETPASTRAFFTKNGEMLVQPMDVASLHTHADWYFPAVGVAAAGGDIFANFGLSYPFRWKGSDRHVLFSPSEVVAAPANSPMRTVVAGSGTNGKSPSKPAPGSTKASTWHESPAYSSPRSQPSTPSVQARIEEMRRLQGAFGHPSRTQDSPPSQPMTRSRADEQMPQTSTEKVTASGRIDDNLGFSPMDEREMNAKALSASLASNEHGESLHASYGSSFSSQEIPHLLQESFGSASQPRQTDIQSGMNVKQSSRPGPESSSVGHRKNSSQTSSASSSLRSHDTSRPSLSSSGLYGRPSDRSIRLDEPFPDEDETPQFLNSSFDSTASAGIDDNAGRVGAHHVHEPAPGRVGAHYVHEIAPGRVGAQWVENKGIVLMERKEIEEATECARQLRECCERNNASFVEEMLVVCRTKQAMIVKTMQEGMIKMADPAMEAPLNELMILNDSLLEAIKLAEAQVKPKSVPTLPPAPDEVRPFHHATTGSLEIETLVNRKDVFSLICMLRAQGDKRLESALALMR